MDAGRTYDLHKKEGLFEWKSNFENNLALEGAHEHAQQIISNKISQISLPHGEKMPDYVYSTTIQLLLSRGLVEESLSVLFEVVWANAGLPAQHAAGPGHLRAGHAQAAGAEIRRLLYRHRLPAVQFRLHSQHLHVRLPSASLEILRSVKLGKESKKGSMINMVVNDLKKKGVNINFDEQTQIEGKQATEVTPGQKMKREAEYLRQAPEGESMERLERLYDNVEEMIVNGQYMVMGKPG